MHNAFDARRAEFSVTSGNTNQRWRNDKKKKEEDEEEGASSFTPAAAGSSTEDRGTKGRIGRVLPETALREVGRRQPACRGFGARTSS